MLNNPESYPHPLISEVKIIEGKNNFPISWLNKQGFCEYGIYLENMKGVMVKPTRAMVKGAKEHSLLESKFKEEAVPATFEEIMEASETGEVLSREFPVISVKYGIRGLIDEILMTPDKFIIIDDKPGAIPYISNIHQVYGYCLAFKEMIDEDDRRIFAALRERGTDDVYWKTYFNRKAENEIIKVIKRVHNLISGKKRFLPTKNPNKCLKCRFNKFCDKKS
ncbi:MAG: Dna2/Cas4 domain-containing protein [Euryarchaeota archaeon]|nr:Dna2/Cas4 domain-containing protein [Euryarchaeota archaeon]